MPSQVGYFDTLKSVAGKVFTYLASITLTGTDGKTITCTQDTSLDEAVAMSSKAPKTDVIKGDGTAGRVLRVTTFWIGNGTGAATLQATTTSVWNGDANGTVDNIAKNATTGVWYLTVAGEALTLLNTGIAGDCVAVLSVDQYINLCGTAVVLQTEKTASGIAVTIHNAATGADLDWTTLVDTGGIYFNVTYITSA